MTMEYEKKILEMENVMKLQTDVIADLNKQITGLRSVNATLEHDKRCLSADCDRLRKELDDEMGIMR